MDLRDDEIVLRPFRDDDVAAIAAACRDPDMARFIPHLPSPYTERDAVEYVKLTRAWDRAGDGRVALAIADAANGRLLGSIDVRLSATGSIGYWVAPWARGAGVATRALILLSRWAIREAGVQRLELFADVENTASQRVAEKAGFQREGVLRAHLAFRDGRRDSVIFSLLPRDLDRLR
jgi:RimJ/RimL family protein N-acetyltransferase